MATMLERDLDKIMRWLRANGIEHGAHEILQGSLYQSGGVIEYETFSSPVLPDECGKIHRTPHRVAQTVTYEQANADA